MTTIRVRRTIRQALGLVCVPLLAAGLLVAQQPAPPAQAPTQLLPPEQLDTLVAPVALYPDALLSQVLVAATYPQEIAEAGQWLQQNRNLQGSQLVDAARQQNWDPSIQALVVFPDVVDRLNADMAWTTDLGNAFLSQQADVMSAVQRMRAQAMDAGKLRSNAQETVTTQLQGDQSAIVIQPANPQIVYVPYYNPEYIWGPPAYGYYPAWDYPDFGYGYGFGFGRGIYIGSFFGGLGWGGWGWGPNWFYGSIFQNRPFFDHYGFGGHGFRHGGTWAHDPGHRRGVPYWNSGRMGGYGSNAGRFGGQSYSAPRANAGQAGGWSRFGAAQRGNRSNSGYGGSSAYRANGGGYGGNRAPSYRSSPSYSNRGTYRASPSYSGGGYSGNRAVAPSYRSSPSYGNGSGYRAAPSYRSSPSFSNRGAYRASPSYSGGGYSGNRAAAPGYRSSPSFSNRGAYRASPSYSGGGYSGSRAAAPSYRSSPSSGGGGSSHSSRSYSGGGSNRSSGNSHSGRDHR